MEKRGIQLVVGRRLSRTKTAYEYVIQSMRSHCAFVRVTPEVFEIINL